MALTPSQGVTRDTQKAGAEQHDSAGFGYRLWNRCEIELSYESKPDRCKSEIMVAAENAICRALS